MNFYKQHGIAQKLARSDIFERITLGVICFLVKLGKLCGSKAGEGGPGHLAQKLKHAFAYLLTSDIAGCCPKASMPFTLVWMQTTIAPPPLSTQPCRISSATISFAFILCCLVSM